MAFVDDNGNPSTASFYTRPTVETSKIPVNTGIPVGVEKVFNEAVGIGGAYGAWGEAYDNVRLNELLEQHLGKAISPDEQMNLAELGFTNRHHVPLNLTHQEDIAVELQVGAMFLRQAAAACGWQPSEVEGVLIGSSGPILDDYTEQIARLAGIPEHALKVSVHKACDGAVAGLNMVLNPTLPVNQALDQNLAEVLAGKKVLVGGIEGLSRFLKTSHDNNALQLFGNGAAVIGVIPGQTMRLITSKSFESFDEEGMLQVKMVYPYVGEQVASQPLTRVNKINPNHYRVAGKMHIPTDEEPVVMAGLMGMVKLFVRNGVEVVRDVYHNYVKRIREMGWDGKGIDFAVVHHANLKINKLKEKHLQKEGVNISIPWVVNDFGNVSAASAMIAFLRQLPGMKPGNHVLIDGFGAGTYYDTLAVALAG